VVVGVGHSKVAEEGRGVADGVRAAMDVGVLAVENESSVAGEDGEAGRAGSMAVVESESV